MAEPDDLEFSHYPATAVPGMRDELIAVHVDARADLLHQPFYSPERYWDRFQAYIKGPGFDLVVAHQGQSIVGYAFGGTLPADTHWWQGLQDARDPDLMRETGDRTFAFREILVRKAHQRHGIAHRLHDELLAYRPEERTTLLVRSDNPARYLYLRWGWTLVGYVQPYIDSPRFEAMIKPLK